MHPPYRLTDPGEPTTALVVASPHSGRYYSPSFLKSSVLNPHAIRSSEDAYVDYLVSDAPTHGAPLLCAEYPRAYLDLNRNADELDPAVISDVGRILQTPRINSGLGVIPRVVANGRAIYRGKMSRIEAQNRIDRIWTPYHAQLEGLMRRAHARFGQAVLLDFHSMPHEALDPVAGPGKARPEVVLGDRFGASADGGLVDVLEQAFIDAGLVVSRNAPFAGAYVVQRYGRPAKGWSAVQVEIDRAIYMDERTITPNAHCDAVREVVSGVIARVVASLPGAVPLAAE